MPIGGYELTFEDINAHDIVNWVGSRSSDDSYHGFSSGQLGIYILHDSHPTHHLTLSGLQECQIISKIFSG